MGSSQSTSTSIPTTTTSPTKDLSDNNTSQASTNINSSENNNTPNDNRLSKPKNKRTGIDAVNYKCRKKKALYDKCVSEWYNERFLTGKSVNQEEECGDLFETYKQCYVKGIKREFFDKGNKKPKEGSLLAEELDE